MNKKKYYLLLLLMLILLPCFALGVTTTFTNPVAPSDEQAFLLKIIEYLQTAIASVAILFIIIGGIIYTISGGEEGRIKTAKNMWTGALIGLTLALIAPTFLKEIQQMFFVGGVMPTDFADVLTLKEVALNVIEFLLSVAGLLATISLVISGFSYIFSFGDLAKAEKAKNMIQWSIIGLALTGASVIIVRQIILFIKIP